MAKQKKPVFVLGISCFYHDSAACLLKNGKVIAAVQEERFTRKKHDDSFPKNAIEYCLGFAKIKVNELSAVAFYDKPLLKFERILTTHFDHFPKGLFSFLPAMRTWLLKKLWVKSIIYEQLEGYKGEIFFPEHHLSHAASSFLVSPFDRAGIITIDGVGEWATTTKGVGEGCQIRLTHQLEFPHSLGLLYSAFTHYLGFKVNSAEYKVMGLAPYGKPKFRGKIIDNLIDLKADGSFRLNLDYFSFQYGLRMTNSSFDELFGGPVARQGQKPGQREMDLAASLQAVTDEIIVRMVKTVVLEHKVDKLCMAGGVALNCVSNTKILRMTKIRDLFIQPAAGDAGGSVGAALLAHQHVLESEGNEARRTSWKNAYLGPEYADDEIEDYLKSKKVVFRKYRRKSLAKKVAKLIEEQNVVGWFQGRMEFGPRALGNRSILADARNPENQSRVNLKVKFRESFRPFAPSVLEEETLKWFDLHNALDKYMLLVAQVKNPSLPAVTHVDGSARTHTVTRSDNPMYYDLISEFAKRTRVPVIINTSFNQRGEPIVCTPKDAFGSFLRTDIDYLVIGSFLIDKTDIPEKMLVTAKETVFDLD